MRRVAYSFVKESFEREGYKLLSEDYINSCAKLDYKCPKGHQYSTSWHNWQQGRRCLLCHYNNVKPTIKQIRESLKNEGYVLISKEYINKLTKLNYKCPYNHEHGIKWDHWQRGYRCPTCAGNNKLTIEQVRESFENEGYVLISKEYINNCTKLDYKCPYNHEHSTKWNNWQGGSRCPTCAFIKMSGPGNPSWRGGISCEPYCQIWRDKHYKEDIKLRDGNKCLNPTCNKKDSRLHIHHIDYNKKNCGPSNLITLCGSCNAKANTDREWHTAWYQALMHMRYNYKY